MLELSLLVLAVDGGEEVNGLSLKHPDSRSSKNVEVRSKPSELDRGLPPSSKLPLPSSSPSED
jgi:hypothetical protein